MIGYEFEFCIRKEDTFFKKNDFDLFHEILKKNGWTQKIDKDTGGILGSLKDGVFVGCDDCKSLMEVNFLPHDTIHDCDFAMKRVLDELSEYLHQIDCSIVCCGTFPGLFDIEECHDVDGCMHPLVTNKGFVKYVAPVRQGVMHHAIFVIAGSHIWLDVEPEKCIEQMGAFSKLSGVFIGLFANGPIANNKRLPMLSGRDYMWELFYSESKHQHYDKNVYGLMEKPFKSICDYFEHVLSSPFFFTTRDGNVFRTKDSKVTHREFLEHDSTIMLSADGFEQSISPTIEDIRWAQNWTFPYVRFKYELKNDVTVLQFMSALNEKSDQKLLNCFSKTHFEIRSIALQPQIEMSAPPSFCLGLQANFDKTKKFIDQYDYDFWKRLCKEAKSKGLDTAIEGVSLSGLAMALYRISEEGLKKRGYNEASYLIPIIKRIQSKKNPAQELLEIWNNEKLLGVFNDRDYKSFSNNIP